MKEERVMALLYSPSQRCLHIETLDKYIENHLYEFERDTFHSDYRLIYSGTDDGIDTFIDNNISYLDKVFHIEKGRVSGYSQRRASFLEREVKNAI